jgi:hypothetical protein
LVSVPSSKFSDAAGNFNVDGSDANNTVTLTVGENHDPRKADQGRTERV